MAVSKRTRFEVLRRDNHACRYCGAIAPDVQLTIDHVIPQSLGGSDRPDNLVAACKDCNSGKSSTPPDAPLVEDVKDAHLRWSRAYKKAAQEAHEDALKAHKRQAEVYAHFQPAWDAWKTADGVPVPLPNNWVVTCDSFIKAGLSPLIILEAIDIACGNQKIASSAVFRYFCGICHNKLREITDRAAEMIGEPA